VRLGFKVCGLGNSAALGNWPQVSGFGFRDGASFTYISVLGSRLRVSGLGSRVPGFGYETKSGPSHLGAEFLVSDFGFRVSDSGFWVGDKVD